MLKAHRISNSIGILSCGVHLLVEKLDSFRYIRPPIPNFIIGWIGNLHNSNFAARAEQWAIACPAIGWSIKLSLTASFTRNPLQYLIRECCSYGALLWICSHEARVASGRNRTTVNYAAPQEGNRPTPNHTTEISGNFVPTRS